MRPFIVPIFIPNQGCPHRCIFCDQETITSEAACGDLAGRTSLVLERAVHSRGFDPARDPEVAFYGGTFTLLPRTRMEGLLKTVAPYLKKGLFTGIRVSTRPDALDLEILALMRAYGVRTVELGAQSMDDEVLALSARGHTSQDTVRAVGLLRRQGFRVGIQLMAGLPGDTPERFLGTVDRVVELYPDMARLYPALVIRGTGLARLYEAGKYEPLGLDMTVELCAEACIRFEARGIPVIRIGLVGSSRLLEGGGVSAGPWHPALGFLVRSAVFHRRIQGAFQGLAPASAVRIRVCRRDIPLLRGFKNRGVAAIEERIGVKVVQVAPDEALPPGTVRVDPL